MTFCFNIHLKGKRSRMGKGRIIISQFFIPARFLGESVLERKHEKQSTIKSGWSNAYFINLPKDIWAKGSAEVCVNWCLEFFSIWSKPCTQWSIAQTCYLQIQDVSPKFPQQTRSLRIGPPTAAVNPPGWPGRSHRVRDSWIRDLGDHPSGCRLVTLPETHIFATENRPFQRGK